MIRTPLLAIVYLFSAWGLRAQTDFTHLSLDVRFDTLTSEVSGTVKLRFLKGPGTDSVGINGIRMNYQKVLLNGADLEYRSDNKALWFDGTLAHDDTNLLEITYDCRPRKGIFFIGWNDKTGIAPRQIWTQGQGIDHRHWIPHKDDQTDKLLIDLKITFNAAYQVIGNGTLIEKRTAGGQAFWHYRMDQPMSSYLIALGIGDYAFKKTFSESGIPLTQYYYPGRADDYLYYYYKNEEIFNFLEKEIGVPYPWPDYKQIPVRDFHHGAMENTTATIFGDFFLVDSIAFNDRNYTYVNAHELAHHWFGDLVTCRNSDHFWLHEGFATYYQWLSEKNLYGVAHFDWERHKAAQLVFEASVRDTIPLGNGKAGSSRFYQKGAWVLHMLRQQLGGDDFKKVVKDYLEENKFGVVTTEALIRSVKKVTGKDYRDFFDRWVFTAGEPSVKARFIAHKENPRIEITGDPGICFCDPFKVKIAYRDGAIDLRETRFTDDLYKPLPEMKATLQVPVSPDKEISYWIMDPGKNILAGIHETKPFEMWVAQHEKSKALLDRYAAVMGIAGIEDKKKESFLKRVLSDEEEFFSIRAEALKQLMAYSKSKLYLQQALRDKDVQLQKEAVLLVQDPGKEIRGILLELLKGDSYELRENVVYQAVQMNKPEGNRWLYDPVFDEQPGIPGHKVKITALLYRFVLFHDEEALKELTLYTSSGYDFITRQQAMSSLSAVQYFDKELAENYFDALFGSNRSLSQAAAGDLRQFYNTGEGKRIIDSYIDWHRETWTDFQKNKADATFGLNQQD